MPAAAKIDWQDFLATGLRQYATVVGALPAAQTPSALDLARRAGIEPDAWQQQLLTSTRDRILLNCSRQSGKSTMTAVLAMHTALYEPGSLTLLISRAERQSGELIRKCKDIYRVLGKPVGAESDTVLQVELENGSRIIALPGSEETIRSYSQVRLLIIDEASRVPDATYYAVRPMLAVGGGRLICPSTPFGQRGWWYEAWIGNGSWERYEVPATNCPRITAQFLADEEREIGTWWFDQEYRCVFQKAVDSPFDAEAVERAFSASGILPLFEGAA